MNKKVLLIIMDGWGVGDRTKSDAIWNANTPFTKKLGYENLSILKASGEDVGLPEGQMGNSEVGHLNIGAGRIVYQDFVRINRAIKDGSLKKNKVLVDAFNYAKINNLNNHLMGLVSDGGVHSSMEHLYALCDYAKDEGLSKVFIHAFMDGRDTDPHSGICYIRQLNDYLKKSSGEIATICGRYYAMDRDKRWERIKVAYDMLIYGKGEAYIDLEAGVLDSYSKGITDEFIKPIIKIKEDGSPIAKLNEGDVVICFNFRKDRCREITTVLSQKDMLEYEMQTLPLHYVTMTRYDETFDKVGVIFDNEDVKMTLGEVLSINGKSQIRIAETEKYPHVTFFFSGGQEEPFDGEKRILIPSPKVATYDLKPSMSAVEIKEAMIKELEINQVDFICLNFANADMVGHTGVYNAIIEAVETVDKCVEAVTLKAIEKGYTVIITADHGNAEYAINEDNTPNTAHTTNPVPIYLLDRDFKEIRNGKLSDIAPTILKLMNIPIPDVMTGDILV